MFFLSFVKIWYIMIQTDPEECGMSKVLVRCIAVGLALLGLFSSSNLAVAKSDATTQLKQVLNSKGYMLASPAINWPYAGGFLVAAKDGATFIDLPSNIERPRAPSAQSRSPFLVGEHAFQNGLI